jgi:hypothetical protein
MLISQRIGGIAMTMTIFDDGARRGVQYRLQAQRTPRTCEACILGCAAILHLRQIEYHFRRATFYQHAIDLALKIALQLTN